MPDALLQKLDAGLAEDRPGQRTTPTRRQRITLLLGSYLDAHGAPGPEREGRSGKPESRILQHTPLWRDGSYHDIMLGLDALRLRAPKVHWHTWEKYVELSTRREIRNRKAALGVEFLHRKLPSFIDVPDVILERGGFRAERRKAA